MNKCVSFSKKIIIHEEPVYLAKALYEARVSDINRRRADKIRMEDLMRPVLENAYKKYLSSMSEESEKCAVQGSLPQ